MTLEDDEESVDYVGSTGRNLYAALILSAINDLNRFKLMYELNPVYHQRTKLNGHLARRWLTRKTSAPISFDTCLINLGFDKAQVMFHMEQKGLLNREPDPRPLLSYYEYDPDPKTLPKLKEHLSRTYEGLPPIVSPLLPEHSLDCVHSDATSQSL